MISADHPRFSCTSDMSLTIYGNIFSGPLVHTNDPSGTVLKFSTTQIVRISIPDRVFFVKKATNIKTDIHEHINEKGNGLYHVPWIQLF